MKTQIYDNISLFYWSNEAKVNDRYFKQKMAMVIYNRMNVIPGTTTLKEVWKEINLYFYLLSTPKHTVHPSNDYYMQHEYDNTSKYYGD